MTTPNALITQEMFIEALSAGIPIAATSRTEQFSFGERMICWINSSDNVFWAAWDPEFDDRIIIDLRNCELMQVWISSRLVSFRRANSTADEDDELAKEFANGVIGIMLFCMIENGEVEELDIDSAEVIAAQAAFDNSKNPPETKEEADDDEPDFDWI
tara:strand:- start:159 stop:632 length:474 start_codon:yes stop_codon:yes gene_type:complete